MSGSDVRGSLLRNLSANGRPSYELPGTNGGSALLVPDAGRVLALFGPGEGESLIFVHPRLLAGVDESLDFLRQAVWKNLGGDRTWIGPEADLHVGDLADPWGTLNVPTTVDPGNYVVQREGGAIRLRNDAQVRLHRPKADCDISVEKIVRMAPNPLRHEPSALSALGSVEYIGYDQVTRLHLLSAPRQDDGVCIWNLLVLPPGGDLIVPVLGPTRVRDFFRDKSRPDNLSQDDRYIRFRLTGCDLRKIGIRAAALVGRAGYVRPVGPDLWTLVVRSFSVNPSGEYVDVPWDEPTSLGWCFESYNDRGEWGGFGELEYHTPAVGGQTGLSFYEDRSQVWAYRGPPSQIRAIGEMLLGQGCLACR